MTEGCLQGQTGKNFLRAFPKPGWRSESVKIYTFGKDENTGKGETDGMRSQRRQKGPEIKCTGGKISEELEDRPLPWSCKEGGWETSRYQPRDICTHQGEKSDRGPAHCPYFSR